MADFGEEGEEDPEGLRLRFRDMMLYSTIAWSLRPISTRTKSMQSESEPKIPAAPSLAPSLSDKSADPASGERRQATFDGLCHPSESDGELERRRKGPRMTEVGRRKRDQMKSQASYPFPAPVGP